MATLPFPPRAAYNSMAFQDPNGPYSEAQQIAADAYGDIVKARITNDRLSGRSQSDPFTAMMGNTSTGPLSNTYYSASANALTNVANRPFSADANNFADSNITRARNELLNRSNEGEFAAPGYGDLGQFAGAFDPANIPMGSNRLSPIDQYKLIKQDAGLLSGDVTLANYRGPLPFGTTKALENYSQVDPQILKDLQNAAAANLGGDSDVGRYGVAGIGDLGQFAGSFDPANVPMGTNRLSPSDQARAIAYDTAVVQSPFTNKDGGAMLAQATSNLAADSDAGRYGVAGIGDLGQFAGSFDALKDDNPYNVEAFANGGEAQAPATNPFADPNTMAVYDQMRQTVSPKEFGDEMLAGAAQIDPEAMAQFRNDLSQIDLSPEELDMLNNMVDEILANPEQYAAVRAKYLEMGAPEELLPEQFDPQFFAAMNMAVDQLIAEPAGVQAFAQGGIAELKPIAKAIASYGRNGDTMLAHITPAEARMLRRRGGSGTINPATGLPEFFLKKAFKSLGKAVKSFASSTVGKIVTTVALGFFLGPAAASFMGVTSAAGVAAVGGFIGGAGSTLLGGGSLKDALKAGAIGGLTAGAVGGVTQGFDTAYAGPTTVGGQVDRFTNAITPSTPASGIQAPAIDAAGQTRGLAPTDVTQAPYKPLEMTGTPSKPFDSYFGSQPPTEVFPDPSNTQSPFTPKKISLVPAADGTLQVPPGSEVRPFTDASGRATSMGTFPTTSPIDATQFPGSFDKTGVAPPTDTSSFMDKIKSGYNEYFSPSNIQAQGMPAAEQAGKAAQDALLARTPTATPAMLDAAYQTAYKAAMPGIVSTYGPLAAAGIGAIGAFGGFKAAPAQPSAMRDQLMKPVTQRIAEGGNQRNYYIQNLPGVKYDQYGAPVYDTGLGIASLAGPRGYAEGGEITPANFDEIAYAIAYPDVAAEIAQGKFKNAYEHYVQYGKAEGRTAFNKAETAAAAAVKDTATKEKQATALGAVATAKAAKKARGSTSAYDNINAGLAFDAPEGYAASARATRQAAFAPTLNKFINAGIANTATLGKAYRPTVVDQPYNTSSVYSNVFSPVATPVNYSTTPVTVQPGVYAPPVFPPFVDNTAAQEAERRRLAGIEAARLAAIEAARLAEIKRLQDAEAERLRLAAAAEAERKRLGQRAYTDQEVKNYLLANPTATDRTIAQAMFDFNVNSDQVSRVTGLQGVSGAQSIDSRYQSARDAAGGNAAAVAAQNAADAVTGQSIRDYFAKTPGMTDRQIATYMDQNAIDFSQLSDAFKGTAGAIAPEEVLRRYQIATQSPSIANASFSAAAKNLAAQQPPVETKLLNMGGIATLGSGGYPRKTGQINGPGTATSDSIPAMLSDGEFVMTAKAVRGAGKGDRRAGAKRMYALMNQLEKNAARG